MDRITIIFLRLLRSFLILKPVPSSNDQLMIERIHHKNTNKIETNKDSMEFKDFSALASNILVVVMYSDLFKYPLSAEDIHNRLKSNNRSIDEVQDTITEIVSLGFLKKTGKFYSTLEIDEKMVNRRLKGNDLARKKLKQAFKISKFINHFPYVRAVFLSGSISKNYMEPDGDIDYFIVTEPNRLWFSRTFLILFKKIFLLNSRKHFCLNYFVDTNKLEIDEKNLFTATELLTLIPTVGASIYDQMIVDNKWFAQYYGQNPKSKYKDNNILSSDSFIKKMLEKLFNNGLGDKIDHKCMDWTVDYWKKKFDYLDNTDFDVALKSRKSVSKHHPNNYQKRVLEGLRKKIAEFEQKHQVKIDWPY